MQTNVNPAKWCLWGVVLLAASMCGEGSSELLFPNSDFEQGNLSNWTTEGKAFQSQPTMGDNVRVRMKDRAALPQGKYWAGTHERFGGKKGQKPGRVQGDKPTGGLLSKGFVISQPYMGFLVGGGSTERTSVQLIVGGEVVYTARGADSPLMRHVYWDLTPYLNKKAMIYAIDHSADKWGFVSIDDFRYVEKIPDTLLFPNSNFEAGDLSNWTADGEAFAKQPVKGDNALARSEGKHRAWPEGDYWIGTFDAYQGKEGQEPGAAQEDKPQGTLKSQAFAVQGKAISFRVGGGDKNVGVRLLVDGEPKRTANGKRREKLQLVVWDVEEFLGKPVEIEIFDKSGKAWGHVNADDFRYARVE